MSDRVSSSKHYEYTLYPKIAGRVLAPLLAAMFAGLALLLFEKGITGLAITFLLFALGWILLVAIGALVDAPIHISDEGIAASKMGWTTKGICWQDVISVKKRHLYNPASLRYDDTFYVNDRDYRGPLYWFPNLYGPIIFSDQLCDVRDLLDRINGYARRFGFPLVVVDEEAAKRAAALHSAGFWQRMVPKVDESRVGEF